MRLLFYIVMLSGYFSLAELSFPDSPDKADKQELLSISMDLKNQYDKAEIQKRHNTESKYPQWQNKGCLDNIETCKSLAKQQNIRFVRAYPNAAACQNSTENSKPLQCWHYKN